MVTKKTGISRELIIHPGETISDVISERNITQAELATRTGVTPAYVSNVISGKKGISSKFAMALEYALDVPKSFWLNLQANYDAELLEYNEANTVTPDEMDVLQSLHEVVAWLRRMRLIAQGESKTDTILSLRKALRISNITALSSLVTVGAFRVSQKASVDPIVMGAWLRLCQVLGERNAVTVPQFSQESTEQMIAELKAIMIDPNANLQTDLARVLAQYGIKFCVVPNFPGAPVHGYISQNKDGEYQMALTIRGAYADIFWFSLFHEIGHIVNGDVSRASNFIDTIENADPDREAAADQFAGDRLLNPGSYAEFIATKDYRSIDAIQQYAASQSVSPHIVIGRLQKEKKIPYSWFSNYKTRYKWIESKK